MKAHPNTDQLNIVVLEGFFFPCIGEIEAFVLFQRSQGELELSAAFWLFHSIQNQTNFQRKL